MSGGISPDRRSPDFGDRPDLREQIVRRKKRPEVVQSDKLDSIVEAAPVAEREIYVDKQRQKVGRRDGQCDWYDELPPPDRHEAGAPSRRDNCYGLDVCAVTARRIDPPIRRSALPVAGADQPPIVVSGRRRSVVRVRYQISTVDPWRRIAFWISTNGCGMLAGISNPARIEMISASGT